MALTPKYLPLFFALVANTYPDSVALWGSAIHPSARDSEGGYLSGLSVRDGKTIGGSRKVATGRLTAETKGEV